MSKFNLTEMQKAVVDDRGGTLLVSAAAGSGKTKVLIDRVLKRVCDEGCNVDDFLMITFTQAAASELRGKLMNALAERLAEQPDDRRLQAQLSRVYLAQISTVHAFCAAILREYAHKTALDADFRICDERLAQPLREKAMQKLLRELYETVEQNESYAAALRMLGAGRDERQLRQLILSLHEAVQSYPDPQARLRQYAEMTELSEYDDVAQTSWGQYLTDEVRALYDDCIDLAQRTLQIARNNPAVEKYQTVLESDLALFTKLRSEESWDKLRARDLSFARMPVVRKCSDIAAQEQIKALRERMKKRAEERLKLLNASAADALRDLADTAPALRGLVALTARFEALYTEEKRRRRYADYADLEHEAYRLLCKDGRQTATARDLSARFTEIMVDEYQDTNAVQDAIFSVLGENKLFFVGDVKQSIYRFRLADPGIFLSKYESFAEHTQAKDAQPRKIVLSENFRSHPQILSAVNDVFSLLMTKRTGGLEYTSAQALRPGRGEYPALDEPAVELHIVEAETDDTVSCDAAALARRVRELLDFGTLKEADGERPIRAQDIVILLRSVKNRAPVYAAALRAVGVESACGNEDLFDTPHIRFLTALLRVLSNPHQDVALLSVLLSPVFGYTADALARIRAAHAQGDLYDALCADAESEKAVRLLSELRSTARLDSMRTLLDIIDEKTGFSDVYCVGNSQARRDMERFLALADDFDRGDALGVSAFLRRIEQLQSRGLDAEAAGGSNAVRIMSIHKSKGLEFPVVILADLSKKFNLRDAYQTVLTDPELGIGCSVTDPQEGVVFSGIARNAIARRTKNQSISEELRVLYVAMTRAQQRLLLFCTGKNPAKQLEALSLQVTRQPSAALVAQAESMAQWLYCAALLRSEMGRAFPQILPPEDRSVPQYPWKIVSYPQSPLSGEAPRDEAQAPEEMPQADFLPPYPYAAACATPSKLTATQLKGRAMDEELPEAPPELPVRLPKPGFLLGRRPLTAAERGTAVHLAMQFVDYARCATLEGAREELARLVRQEYLTAQQAEAVEPRKLTDFFASATGQRVLRAERVVREFKFSVLEDASRFGFAEEKILLQGVTDCCFFEEDGLVVLDFKSDRVAPGGESARAEYYRGQLDAYSRALSRIFQTPVKQRIVYFFATATEVSL